MKKEIPETYKGTIKDIEKKFSKEDKKVIEDYVRFRRTKAGDEKVDAYKRMLIIMRDLAEVPFSKFNNKKLIDNLLILIKNADRERAGKNELRKTLKNFLKWKFNDLSLIDNIRLEKDFNEKKFNSNTLMTPEEVEQLIRACKNLKERAMVVLQLELGLRPHELLSLKWKNIKFNDNHGVVEVYANKTNQVRTLPFKQALIHLMRYRDEFEFPDRKEDDWIFPNPNNRANPLYKQYMSMIYRTLCKRAKIRSITPYLARHSVMSSIYKKTHDSRLTARFGGHSMKTSEIYVNLNEKDIKDIILEEIYDIKEPDIQTKHRLEREIDKLIKNGKYLAKNLDLSFEINRLLIDNLLNHRLDEEDTKKLKDLFVQINVISPVA